METNPCLCCDYYIVTKSVERIMEAIEEQTVVTFKY